MNKLKVITSVNVVSVSNSDKNAFFSKMSVLQNECNHMVQSFISKQISTFLIQKEIWLQNKNILATQYNPQNKLSQSYNKS